MFIAKEFSLPQERGSCCEVIPAPLIEDVQGPRARPRSSALKKRGPNAADALGVKMGRKGRGDICKTSFQPRAQRSAKPFFPRQRECPLLLSENFFRQKLSQSFHQ